MDLNTYRNTDREKARTEDLLRLLPRDRSSVLDIGARDGHFSRLLTRHFTSVTALDLDKPPFEHAGIDTVAGDVTHLEFQDNSFDCVFCAEVLEHIPGLQQACREISRVARHEVLIGVPFKQETRLGRTTCIGCGAKNPPWGHVNTFDEHKLRSLFPDLSIVSTSFVGSERSATNSLAVWLMDRAGNPWGSYNQEETCIRCGALLQARSRAALPWERVCSGIAYGLNKIQTRFTSPHGNWIHMLFAKDPVLAP